MRNLREIRIALVGVLTMVALLPAVAQEFKAPKISGMVNVRYAWSDKEDDTHGFDIRRIRLAADGSLSDKLDYKFQAEYETTVKVIDAFLRWKITPAFNIQIGEYKVQYSQETLYGPATWLTIENPAAVARLNGYNDLSGLKANGRDVGVTFYGDLFDKVVSYRVGVFNGNGINTKDDNNKKDFAGLIWIRPLKELAFSVGHYQGVYGAKGDEHVRIRTSAGVEYKDDRLTLRGEYLNGNTAGQKSDGAYATAAYWVSKVVQPVVSVDYFKADRDQDEQQWNYQVGVNVIPIKKLRIQAAYTYINNKVAKDVNQFETQFILQF
ncbi:MAG: porin [Prevotella sp.]|nr:porin [Prevotella sp.]